LKLKTGFRLTGKRRGDRGPTEVKVEPWGMRGRKSALSGGGSATFRVPQAGTKGDSHKGVDFDKKAKPVRRSQAHREQNPLMAGKVLGGAEQVRAMGGLIRCKGDGSP